MRVLIFAKSIDGGTGTYFLSLMKLGRLLGPSADIKALVLEKPRYRKIKMHVEYYHTEHVYPERYRLTMKAVVEIALELRWFVRKVKTFNPEVIVSVDIHCAMIAAISKMMGFARARQVVTIHNNLAETLSSKSSLFLLPFMRRMARFVLSKSDKVVCPSRSLSRNLGHQFKLERTPSTIYNGIPLGVHKRKLQNGGNIIIWTGRLVEQKDPMTILRAFVILKGKVKECKLWLVGEGPMEEELRQFVREAGLTESVRFFGWVQNPGDLMDKADLFVLSSKREGFGYVLIEAMSRGLPVVSTDCPYGPSEILDKGKSGLLVPVGNVHAFADSMAKLLEDKNLYMRFSRESQRRSGDFSEKQMLKKYAELIQQVADQ